MDNSDNGREATREAENKDAITPGTEREVKIVNESR